MVKNNFEIDVKVKCMEEDISQAQLAKLVGTSAPYVSRLLHKQECIVNKTFVSMLDKLGYEEIFMSLNGFRNITIDYNAGSLVLAFAENYQSNGCYSAAEALERDIVVENAEALMRAQELFISLRKRC